MATEISVGGNVSSYQATHSTIGRQASIVLATLQKNAEQQEIASRPLKIPDLRMFGLGRNVNMIM